MCASSATWRGSIFETPRKRFRSRLSALAELLNRPYQAGAVEVRGQDHARAWPHCLMIRRWWEWRFRTVRTWRLSAWESTRARAEVRLAHANKWSDVFWLVQPYTFQDNSPYNAASSHSWATGVTVPLPLLNRNQGNIQRAQLNVAQTQTELAALEQRVAAEVLQARKDLLVSQAAVENMRERILPAARQILESERLKFDKGEVDVLAWRLALRQYNDVVNRYRETLDPSAQEHAGGEHGGLAAAISVRREQSIGPEGRAKDKPTFARMYWRSGLNRDQRTVAWVQRTKSPWMSLRRSGPGRRGRVARRYRSGYRSYSCPDAWGR